MQYAAQVGLAALSSLLSIAVLFLLAKLMGTKQVSQMTMFDYVVGITIGSIAAELATELKEPLRPLTALIVYGVTAFVISILTNKFLKVRSMVTGKPLVLLENGVIYRENLKKARLDLNEFLTYCRIGGWFDLNQLQSAVLEHNGVVSFLPKEADRPATPADLNLNPKQSKVQMPFVMDGRLLEENIRQAGKEDTWVRRTLLQQGCRDEGEVLLAVWDGGEKLTVFPMDSAGKRKRN